MNRKSKFITTRNPKTSEQLKKMGLELVSDNNGTCTFINTLKKIDFESIKDAHFTDILTF